VNPTGGSVPAGPEREDALDAPLGDVPASSVPRGDDATPAETTDTLHIVIPGPPPDDQPMLPLGRDARAGLGTLGQDAPNASTPRRIGLIAGLMLGVVAVAFESFGITTVMPAVVEDLGHVRLYAWAFTMFMLGQVFAIVVAGRLCDRLGALLPLCAGMGLFAIGLASAALSPSMHIFICARLIQGLGGGALNLALMVVVAEAFDERARPKLMTAFSFCYLLPAFVGPLVAGYIAERLSWHWVFWSVMPFVVVASALGAAPLARLYRNRAPAQSEHEPVPLWAAGLAAGGVALIQASGQDLADRGVGVLTVVLAILGVGGVVVALPRLMPPRIWRLGRGLPAVMGARGALAGAFFAAQSFITMCLSETRGMELQNAGLALTVGALGWALGSLLQTQSWLKLRRDQIIALGAVAVTIGLALMALLAGWRNCPLIVLGLGLLLTGFGMGMASAGTSLATMTLSAPERIGHNTSSLQVADNLACAFIGGIAGTLFAGLHHWHSAEFTFAWLFGVVSALALMGVFLSLRIGPVRNTTANVG